MKKRCNQTDTINLPVASLLYCYIKYGLIIDPSIFKLRDLSNDSLLEQSFDKVGGDEFSIYEKTFRVFTQEIYVNFKVHFVGNVLSSNGVEVTGGRMVKVLADFNKKFGDEKLIKQIQLFLDDSLTSGAVVINNNINVGFQMSGSGKYRDKFRLSAIATDFGFTDEWTEKALSTYGTKIMCQEISLSNVSANIMKIGAVDQLVNCIRNNFDAATYIRPVSSDASSVI